MIICVRQLRMRKRLIGDDDKKDLQCHELTELLSEGNA